MHFTGDRWERRFQLSFNRGCMRTDLLYSLCLAAFGLSAIYRLQHAPGTACTLLATTPLLACVPLLLLLTSLWPAHYVRHRQPIVSALKVWAAFVASLLPDQLSGGLAAAAGGCGDSNTPAGLLVTRVGLGLTAQLVLHALGLQTTGAWLVFSQGFVVAASARTSTVCCSCYLAPAVRQLLESATAAALPYRSQWFLDLLRSTDPTLLCEAYTVGLQILVGYAATVLVALGVEWRQRQAYAAKHQLPPPSHVDFLALHGAFVTMLFFLWRVALAEAVRMPVKCGGGQAWGGASSAPAAGVQEGSCPVQL